MSLDPSLKPKGGAFGHRNVLTRAERLAKLIKDGKHEQDASPLGLRKVANRKIGAAKK